MTRGSTGTIDFRHDVANDIVVMRPRWTLDTPLEVTRWYQMQAGYFAARFSERKDVVMLNDAFDITPQVATLWGKYRARVHELYIRHSVRVANTARVRLTTHTSGVRYSVSSIECATLEEAIETIKVARRGEHIPSGTHRRDDTPPISPPKVSGT
jgi:hypothetical protein